MDNDTPIQETPEFKNALASELLRIAEGLRQTAENAITQPHSQPRLHTPKYKSYATKPPAPKIEQYARWVEREFPELYPDGLSEHDVRLISIAIRTYQDFQREANGRPPR